MPFALSSKHVPLPKNWSNYVQSVALHVICLAQYALIQVRGWAADSINPRLRLSGEIERLETEVSLLRFGGEPGQRSDGNCRLVQSILRHLW